MTGYFRNDSDFRNFALFYRRRNYSVKHLFDKETQDNENGFVQNRNNKPKCGGCFGKNSQNESVLWKRDDFCGNVIILFMTAVSSVSADETAAERHGRRKYTGRKRRNLPREDCA